MAKGSKEKEGKSALEAAYRALEAGDAATARRLAKRVTSAPSAEDAAAVKRVAKLLLGEAGPTLKGTKVREGELLPDEPDAKSLAQNIVQRTRPVLRPYLWAIGGATAYALLLTMALVRYG